MASMSRALGLCLVLLAAPAALAQDADAPPRATLSLAAGFAPDPTLVSIEAVGEDMNAANLSSACGGLIGAAADLKLAYAADSDPLIISAASVSDAALLVRAPNGAWYCSAGESSADPALAFNHPESGDYLIWIGSGAGADSVELRFSAMVGQ